MMICVISGYTYFITFTNDYPRYGYVYLMKHKSELFERFKEFRNEVEKQTEKSIKILQLDQDGEYLSQLFQDYLKIMGFSHNGHFLEHNLMAFLKVKIVCYSP